MIVRHKHKSHFVVVPNTIFDDVRLSVEAKGMLGYLLSRPHSWSVRHGQLQRTLGIGRKLLDRIMQELIAAGYVDRDREQGRNEHNQFKTYNYVVTDVPKQKSEVASAIISGVRTAHRRKPVRQKDTDSKTESTKTDSTKLLPNPFLIAQGDAPQASQDKYSDLGKRALASGLARVFEGSEPFRAWSRFRGVDGMPPIDEGVIDGKRRRIVWMPALYPPHQRGDGDGDSH
jgi:DNA-binding HxlR family transcriptional regulator